MKFEDLIKYINDNKDKIGNINKYKDEKWQKVRLNLQKELL
jgi:hypothetical protein